MLNIIIEGLLLGLSTGVACLGVCLVFFMPYLLVEGKQSVVDNLRNILFFMLGRLISYIGFALFMGFLATRHKPMPARFSYFSLIIISCLMLIYALTQNFRESGFCRRLIRHFSSVRMPFVLGLLLGLSPCVPFLAGVLRIWTLQSVYKSVILFFAFFLGTSVYMIPLIFTSFLNRIERVKRIGLIMAFISGAWFLFEGILGLMRPFP